MEIGNLALIKLWRFAQTQLLSLVKTLRGFGFLFTVSTVYPNSFNFLIHLK